MTVTLMPDVEYVLWVFLSAQSEVTTLVSSRIYRASLPSDPVAPAVKITRVSGDTLVGYPPVYDESRLQLDIYGGTQREANRIAETIRQVATLRLHNYRHADGEIKSCYAEPPIYQPDTEGWATSSGAPRPRYIVDLLVRSRPPSPVAITP